MRKDRLIGEVNHAIVYVRDVRRAVDFWTKKVGLTVSYWDGPHAEFEGTVLTLLERRNARPRDTGINFGVRDIHAAHKKLRAKGVRFEEPPKKQAWGAFLAVFYDNEGNSYFIEG